MVVVVVIKFQCSLRLSLSFCGVVGWSGVGEEGGGDWGVQSHFRVKPNYSLGFDNC